MDPQSWMGGEIESQDSFDWGLERERDREKGSFGRVRIAASRAAQRSKLLPDE